MECAKKLIFFPPKGGVSAYYSPRMILHQKSLDYKKTIPFGSYVQAHTEPEPRNTQLPRTLDFIYLRYTDNVQGGHTLLDLKSGRLITRRNVTVIPITSNVIDIVHSLAEKDGIKDGCKIISKSGITLYDSSWIAGVGEKENNEEQNYNETDNEIEDTYETDNDFSIATMDEMNPNITADILHEKTNNENSNPTGGDAKAPEEFNPETEFENDDTSEDEDVDEDTTNGNDDVSNNRTRTRSGRQIIPPSRLSLYQEHLVTQTHEKNEYTQD
jgi:hypothetical protein